MTGTSFQELEKRGVATNIVVVEVTNNNTNNIIISSSIIGLIKWE